MSRSVYFRSVLVAAGSAILLFGAAGARAALITTPVQTLNFAGRTDFTVAQSFQLFDSNMGALQSVNLSNAYGIQYTFTMTNNGPATSTGYARITSDLDLSASDGAIDATLKALLPALSAQTGKVALTAAPDSVWNMSGSTSTLTNALVLTDPANLEAFSAIGGGASLLTGATATETILSYSGGNTGLSQITTGAGSFSISYTYDDAAASAVPETASWAMMLLGFGGIGTMLRRRTVRLRAA